MIVVDLNLLLYAINEDAADHGAARAWWERVLAGDEPVGLPWTVVLGFLRIATHPRVFPSPLSAAQALDLMDEWLDRPPVRIAEPGTAHWRIFRQLLDQLGTAGNLTSDAHLAAIAIEHGASLCSTDNDFSRFPAVHWIDPLRS